MSFLTVHHRADPIEFIFTLTGPAVVVSDDKVTIEWDSVKLPLECHHFVEELKHILVQIHRETATGCSHHFGRFCGHHCTIDWGIIESHDYKVRNGAKILRATAPTAFIVNIKPVDPRRIAGYI